MSVRMRSGIVLAPLFLCLVAQSARPVRAQQLPVLPPLEEEPLQQRVDAGRIALERGTTGCAARRVSDQLVPRRVEGDRRRGRGSFDVGRHESPILLGLKCPVGKVRRHQ